MTVEYTQVVKRISLTDLENIPKIYHVKNQSAE